MQPRTKNWGGLFTTPASPLSSKYAKNIQHVSTPLSTSPIQNSELGSQHRNCGSARDPRWGGDKDRAVRIHVEAQLRTDLAALEGNHNEDEDVAAGEAIGRDVAADVLAQAATDNYFVVNPGVPPVRAGYWVSAAAPIVRGLYGARPFFLKTADQLRPPPPPAF